MEEGLISIYLESLYMTQESVISNCHKILTAFSSFTILKPPPSVSCHFYIAHILSLDHVKLI